MGIQAVRGRVTTRTYPRLMTHRLGALALITEDGRGIYMDGDGAGKAFNINGDEHEDWSDYVGSVTLHNND